MVLESTLSATRKDVQHSYSAQINDQSHTLFATFQIWSDNASVPLMCKTTVVCVGAVLIIVGWLIKE